MKRQSLYSKQSLKRLSEYPDVLTVEEASEILGVCTKTVYKMIKKGDLKKQNVGRLFRIPKSYIVAYLGIENKK
ncbi:helix-turn-helix domain-containing protein [Anaerocolumna xylanovorans]|uniref:DNA binding domain-containing protein, excisionase family n=1 Tax=Anaerocolumna xylanovorans DSM 12503 TaxID=1121345 RepID=A0A1M7Y0Q9_9FIRM|nr:helix-turn-helix domain-containing protein [Anaerocolumna xylanovorans]SHO45210.1 DNA binding domain-containing protein, excisionase family [Anaerocolumna xylanovorans DSM 12503]